MKIFFAFACLLVSGAIFAQQNDAAQTHQQTDSAEALKEQIAKMEGDMQSLREENRRLRKNLRKIRTQLFELQQATGTTDGSSIGKTQAEKVVEEDLSKNGRKVPQKKEQTFWDWFTQ